MINQILQILNNLPTAEAEKILNECLAKLNTISVLKVPD